MIGMRRLTALAPMLAVLAGLPHAAAQAQPSAKLGMISSEQRARIEEHVLAERRPSVTAPADFKAVAGGTLPLGIELFWMSPAVELNHYRYAVIEGRTVVVVPYTRQIVAVLE